MTDISIVSVYFVTFSVLLRSLKLYLFLMAETVWDDHRLHSKFHCDRRHVWGDERATTEDV